MLRKLATVVLGAAIAVVISSKARPETVPIEEYIGKTIENSVTDAFQKAAELAEAKVESNAEFYNARLSFYAQLEKGVLGSPEEERFALLLYQKDIYYLSLYAAEGVYAGEKRIRAVDALSGGHALDGGIDSFAKDSFQVWVNDVRAKLGAKHDGELIMPPSPAQFMQAIVDTSDSYNRYRKARDRLELLRWRASRPLIYAPKATTPETRADTYIRVVLDPTIDKELANFPAEQRDAAKQKLNDWVMTLREAIIEFETISLTPEDVTEVMKYLDFSEQDMAYFWSRLGDRKELQGNDFLVAVDQALAQTQNFRDLRQHGRQFDSQPASWDTQLKTWKLKQSGKLNYRELYNAQPVKFARVTYHEVAHAIANGSLGSESPLPVFRRYGTASQPQANAPSAPAFPETKSEPERLLPAVEADKSATDARKAAAVAKLDAARQALALKDQAVADQEATRVSADASVRAAAAGYLRGEKSSLDVLGVRLGMTVDEADNMISKAISVGWVLTSADNPAKFDAIVHLRIYVSTDLTQAVALTLPHDDQPQYVIGVERIVQVASTVPDASILQLLQEKYGAPVSTDSTRHEWAWGEVKPQTLCEVWEDIIPNPQIVSGSPVPTTEFTLRFSHLALETRVGGPNVTDLGEFANCRPAVHVIRGVDNLDTVLWDMRALVSVTTSTSLAAAAASGKVVTPAIKF